MQADSKISLNKYQSSSRFHALMLISVVICVGILFVYTFRFNQEVSQVENRRLAQWPALNKESVLNGQFAQGVETYVADHFPGRAWLTEVAFMIRTYRGVELKNRVIQVKDVETAFDNVSQWAVAEVVPEVIAISEISSESDFFVADENEHVGIVIKPKAAPQQKPLNVVGGVLLYEGQALFMFQGTDRGAQGYANAVNTWVELVAKKRAGMTATVVVTPTSSHFYLPPAARARTTSEEKNLIAMRNALLPEVRFADVIKEMEGHQEQLLFYKSDHHWTGLGAYYAYRAWAKVAGVVPLELSDFDKRSVPGVAGSYWSLTQAPELRHADNESYYYVPKTVTFDGTQYTGPQQKIPVPQSFFAEKSRGYIVFLGGDIPLLASNTNAGTGRTALVVKNSYGNAFAPYLLPHFDRVVVLDYRYVSRNIQDIVDSFGVTDLVFVNATITANSGAHQERMRQVARGSSTAWLTEAEKRLKKQQEDAAQ